MYYLGGRFHCVPQVFQVPRMALGGFITCQCCGNNRENIMSIRFTQSQDLGKKWKSIDESMEEDDMVQYVNKAARISK